jgi:hypothetical protein
MRKAILVTLLSALAAATSFAAEMTGYISDTKCASEHSKAQTAAEWIHPAVFETCAVQCVKEEGSTPIFLTADNKILKIDPASLSKAMPHLGHKVAITGKVEGDTVKIESISTVKW